MAADFIAPFIAVGLAELGDKTQLALILLSTRTKRRVLLLSGAVLGFLLVDGVAVAAGSWVGDALPRDVVKAAAGLAFILFGAVMLMSGGENDRERIRPGNPFISSFLLISLTEFGDKTQIAAGLFAARYNPLMVLAGAMASLTLLSAAAIALGSGLSARVNPEKASRIAGMTFIIIGVGTVII
ncbi:MAG: UPF0016 domain-containing protein [Candidatus Altiarchaeales archaeon]|nr:UPF0016 domain-containing protein [Candidatus Altiarchaeales archaeon]MBD3416863.1 UPF0016 domain-containing protein [Candidatus Altiarchaeales archaeon]